MGLLLASCTATEKGSNNYKVEYKGALKNAMFKGDLSAKIDLSDLQNTTHLYALGAFENLKGEVQIFAGKPFNTIAEDGVLVFDQSFNKKATLLVYASVKEWQNIVIPDSIVTYEQFETFVDFMANENHLDTNEPFPFMLSGVLQSFEWHVINWKDGDTDHSHEKHVQSGLNGTINNRQVKMLGFYSDSHHAIFTHHTTNMHIHVKTKEGNVSGHVDGLLLIPGITLKIPEVN